MNTSKKICLVFNHLQFADGVCRSAIAIANLLVREKDVEVDLIPLFKYDKEVLSLLDERVTVKTIFCGYFRGLADILTICPLKLLYKLIIRKKYDIEIAFQFGPATKILSASTNVKSLKLVWMHGYDYGLTYHQYYKKYHKVITVSKCNAERFRSETNDLIKVDYVYNPIDDNEVLKNSKELTTYNLAEGLKFIAVGRLSPEKGYERLVKEAARLINEGYSFHLYIIGDGPTRGSLEKLIKDNAVDNNVVLMGSKSNPHKYMSKCDIMICSSYSEGYSTVCAESIMLGVPVISTAVSGAVEIIEDSGAGMVMGMNDEDLYKALKYILLNPSIIDIWKECVKRNNYRFSQDERSKKLFTILGV